jgi:4-diphosphocytidyl-2C-methyl-D-erythritol kinase
MRIEREANAKINWALWVTGVRPTDTTNWIC